MRPITVCWARCRAVLRSKAGDGERGASLVEYAMLLALIVVVCVAAVTFIGDSSSESLSSTASMIP